jgi:hypothetical protein
LIPFLILCAIAVVLFHLAVGAVRFPAPDAFQA